MSWDASLALAVAHAEAACLRLCSWVRELIASGGRNENTGSEDVKMLIQVSPPVLNHAVSVGWS